MLAGAQKPTCYALMPFSPDFDGVFLNIRTTVEGLGMECHRSDTRAVTGSLIEGMITDIVLADVIVADISGVNPNVLYELGIAHALSKPTILLSQDLADGKRLPFDLASLLTVKYDPASSEWIVTLHQVLQQFLSSSDVHSNPVEASLRAQGVRLANHFREPFLWGYARTFQESSAAREAWIVSHQLYWERLDSSFFAEILENRILKGRRLELVLMPDTTGNRNNKGDLLRRHKNIEQHLRILLIPDARPFCFLPTEISIYDPGTPQLRAILLEPMAHEGYDVDNDAKIAVALASGSTRQLRLYNLKEATFDVALSRPKSEQMCQAFRSIWNEAAEPAWHL